MSAAKSFPPGIPSLRHMVHSLKAAGMTQREIGRVLNCQQNFISNMSTGLRAGCSFPIGMRLYRLYANRVLGMNLALVPNGKGASAKK